MDTELSQYKQYTVRKKSCLRSYEAIDSIIMEFPLH